MKTIFGLALLCLSLIPFSSTAQCPNPPCPNAIQTAVPFLRLATDARSGGMGEVGLAISPDANAMHFNASKLALADKNFGIAASYTPWLRALGLRGVYLAELNSYKKLGKTRAVGMGFKFYSGGKNEFVNSQSLGVSPREFSISLAYAQALGEKIALGITPKFIYSRLSNNILTRRQIKPALAGAVDLSFTYRNAFTLGERKSELTLATAISNIGTNKIRYTESIYGDFLPCNWGIGAAWKLALTPKHKITFALDFNKLLVPTPNSEDIDGIAGPDYLTRSIVSGIFSSFSDAPGGIEEEFREVTLSFGVEYSHKWFALRSGVFLEDETKGGRKFFTVGGGAQYKTMSFNCSYLISAYQNKRTPLDNTVRFTLLLDFPTS